MDPCLRRNDRAGRVLHSIRLFLWITLFYFSSILPVSAASRDCPGDMVLWKTPGSASAECVCPDGRSMEMDISKPLAKFGKCTETYNISPPPEFQNSLTLWLDASDPYATGYRPSSGAIITNWYDKSPSKLIFNGRASYMGVLQFEDSNQTGFTGTNPTPDFTNQSFTIFIVEKNKHNNQESSLLTSPSWPLTIMRKAMQNQISWLLGDATINGPEPFSPEDPANKYLNIFTFVRDADGCLAIFRQGESNFDPSCGLQLNPHHSEDQQLIIAKNYKGYIMEILLYQGALSAYEHKKVEQYLAVKWGGSIYYEIK